MYEYEYSYSRSPTPFDDPYLQLDLTTSIANFINTDYTYDTYTY